MRLHPRVVEAGYHIRELKSLTGLTAEDKQAARTQEQALYDLLSIEPRPRSMLGTRSRHWP